MYTEWTLYVLLSGVAFVVAMVSVMRRWLRADADAEQAEMGLRAERGGHDEPAHIATMTAMDGATTADHSVASPARGSVVVEKTGARALARPTLIAESEGAVARLCFGWGGGGLLVGMLSGAATHGLLGALLGSVVVSAAAVGVVVVVVLVSDRATLRAWDAEQTKSRFERRSHCALRSKSSIAKTMRVISPS